MATITLDELLDACKAIKRLGHGKKKILLSGDDEGNSYHELFFLFTSKVEDFDLNTMPFGVNESNINEYIILG